MRKGRLVLNGRLIIDGPASGAWNMSVDAAILETFQAPDRPTLRFYRWSRPTLSLGYFQSIQDRCKHHESESIDVVRRATGGGAIIHDHELTYSLTVPHAARMPGASGKLYQTVHRAMINSLASLGIKASRFGDNAQNASGDEPFLCFQRRTEEDLVISGYKIGGSAQRRTSLAILQHGSLLISASQAAPQLPGILELVDTTATGRKPASSGSAGRSQPGNTGHCEAIEEMSIELMNEITTKLEESLSLHWLPEEITAEEAKTARQLKSERFSHASWVGKR